MKTRDRTVLIAVLLIAALGGAWMLVVSPEREKASSLDTQVAAAKAQLSAAEGELSNARAAETKYTTAYSSLVSLGKAVPAGDEVPALIFQLSVASQQKNVDFSSIVASSTPGAGSSSRSSSSSAASSSSASSTASASLTQMPFTFIFSGGFFDLERLFSSLNAAVQRTPTSALRITGRLLTIQSVKLSPVSATPEPGKPANNNLTGTITATAYVLPAGQGLANAPATSTGTSPASSTSGASSSPTAPAIVRVGP
jgi:hypothetical protein